MKIAFSINGVPIRMTEERWKHIITRHPETEEYINEILETIQNPDLIQQGDTGTLLAVKKIKKENIILVVVYREINKLDGFILTAYMTNRLRRRIIVWKP